MLHEVMRAQVVMEVEWGKGGNKERESTKQNIHSDNDNDSDNEEDGVSKYLVFSLNRPFGVSM